MSTSVIQFRNARWSTIGLGVILLLSGVHAAWADPVSTVPAPAASSIREREPVTHVISPSTKLSMIQLDARILEFSKRIESVDGFNSEILSVTAESPTRIRLHAETTGVTALAVRDESGAVFNVEVFVEGDVRELRAYLEKLFPNAALEVVSLKDSVVLRGWVTEPDIIPQIMAFAKPM